MAKMTKGQFMNALSETLGVPKKTAIAAWDKLIEMAYREVRGSGEFNLPGLGKLVKKSRAARTGRNPATGATIEIPAKTVVKFRVAKQVKDAVL
jgi:DNA-binding protein HU-beta